MPSIARGHDTGVGTHWSSYCAARLRIDLTRLICKDGRGEQAYNALPSHEDVDAGSRGMYWLTVGDIHFCSRRYPEAIQSFHEALLLELQSGIPLTLASLQLRIARALLCSGRYRQADALLDKCAPVMDQAWAPLCASFLVARAVPAARIGEPEATRMVEHAIGLIKADLPYSSVVKSQLLRAESEMCEINGCPEAADLLRAPAGAVDARAAAAASVGAR